MLVLSRKIGESIRIADDIEIVIDDIRGANVRLGITAPKHIPVHRLEVYEAIRRDMINSVLHRETAKPFEQPETTS